MTLNNKRVGLIVALMREMRMFLPDVNLLKIPVKPFPVYIANWDGIEVVCAVSGLGKARAAACTQHLIDSYKLDLVINAGSSGGVCPRLAIGDIVAAACCVEYDFRSVREKTPLFIVEPRFLEIAVSLGAKLEILGSADQNADTKNKKEKLHALGVALADWEGIGVIKTCSANAVPAVLLKVITDTANTELVKEFLENVGACNAKLAEFVRRFISSSTRAWPAL